MEKVWYSVGLRLAEYKIIILYTASGINNNTRKVGALIKRKYIHRSRNCSYEPFQNNKRYPKLVYNYNIIITTFNMQLINDTRYIIPVIINISIYDSRASISR